MSFFSKRYHPPGTPPGTLTELSAEAADAIHLRRIRYSADRVEVQEHAPLAACDGPGPDGTVTWIHVQGTPGMHMLRTLASRFGLHMLALEDVQNTGQRPKVEPFEDQLFVVMSLPMMVDDDVRMEQISLFFGPGFVLSICSGRAGAAPFSALAERLQDAGSRLRGRGADYLLYSLLDLVIDAGFPVLEAFGDQMEDLEHQILRTTDSDTLERIHVVKRELILLRRMLWPQREVINALLRDGHALIADETRLYLRDCYDHSIQVMDLLETYRDMSGSMLDIYLSSVSNRMNEVMRVLTVIATIFIPLTFIVGVYGMNFDRSASRWNMPELGWSFGYPLVWLVMIAVTAGMLAVFRRRGWF